MSETLYCTFETFTLNRTDAEQQTSSLKGMFHYEAVRPSSDAIEFICLKAMLHEAIFLATCLATMTTEEHCKLQRGCHTFAIFFCNLQRPRWKLFTTLSPPA